jgi:hypothetical protein
VVSACTAIELVPLPVPVYLQRRIVAIPAVDDVLAIAPNRLPIVAVACVDDIIALAAKQEGLVARTAVDDVVAVPSEDKARQNGAKRTRSQRDAPPKSTVRSSLRDFSESFSRQVGE